MFPVGPEISFLIPSTHYQSRESILCRPRYSLENKKINPAIILDKRRVAFLCLTKIQHTTFDDVQSTTENGPRGLSSAKRTRAEEEETNARTSKGQPRVSRLFCPRSPFTVRPRCCQLSKQLQMRLQYAKLKVEHGWVRSFSDPCPPRAHRCARTSNDKTSTRSKTSTFTIPTSGACDRGRRSDNTLRP